MGGNLECLRKIGNCSCFGTYAERCFASQNVAVRFRNGKNSAAAICVPESRLTLSIGQSLHGEEFERLVVWLVKNAAIGGHRRSLVLTTSVRNSRDMVRNTGTAF